MTKILVIADIASRVNFSSQSHLTEHFKRVEDQKIELSAGETVMILTVTPHAFAMIEDAPAWGLVGLPQKCSHWKTLKIYPEA
jgi:hypothetical protein